MRSILLAILFLCLPACVRGKTSDVQTSSAPSTGEASALEYDKKAFEELADEAVCADVDAFKQGFEGSLRALSRSQSDSRLDDAIARYIDAAKVKFQSHSASRQERDASAIGTLSRDESCKLRGELAAFKVFTVTSRAKAPDPCQINPDILGQAGGEFHCRSLSLNAVAMARAFVTKSSAKSCSAEFVTKCNEAFERTRLSFKDCLSTVESAGGTAVANNIKKSMAAQDNFEAFCGGSIQ